jgi:phosphatidylserine decarboxylase
MIHKEGRVFLLVLLALLALVYLVLYLLNLPPSLLIIYSLLSLVTFVFCLQFFRNPKIAVFTASDKVIAPADGKVVVIEETEEEEYFGDRRIQISIFMSPIDKHINRNPVDGMIAYLKYHAGKYLVAWHPKASTDNERTTIVYRLAGGTEVLLRQIAGAMARRIRWYIEEGDAVQQGQEFGFIKFGSRVDVFLPVGAEVLVKKDQKTKAGITALARLP